MIVLILFVPDAADCAGAFRFECCLHIDEILRALALPERLNSDALNNRKLASFTRPKVGNSWKSLLKIKSL
jgi:hypothetical protein